MADAEITEQYIRDIELEADKLSGALYDKFVSAGPQEAATREAIGAMLHGTERITQIRMYLEFSRAVSVFEGAGAAKMSSWYRDRARAQIDAFKEWMEG